MDDMCYELKQYSLNNDLCIKSAIHSNSTSSIQKNTLSKKKNVSKINNADDYPTKDRLFWMTYLMVHEKDEYKIDYLHPFQTEKNTKIKWIEGIQSTAGLLKSTRVLKKQQILDNLQGNKMSIPAIHAVCILFKINLMYTIGNVYYEIITTEDTTVHMIIDNVLTLCSSIDTQNNCRNDKFLINNWDKPMRSLSYYTLNDLREISERLKLSIIGKTKTLLYDNICEYIKIE